MDKKGLVINLTELKDRSLFMDAEKQYICGFYNGIEIALSRIEDRPVDFKKVGDLR